MSLQVRNYVAISYYTGKSVLPNMFILTYTTSNSARPNGNSFDEMFSDDLQEIYIANY